MTKFAVYSKKIDREKIQNFLNPVIEGKISYGTDQDLAVEIHNKMGAGEFYFDKKPSEGEYAQWRKKYVQWRKMMQER